MLRTALIDVVPLFLAALYVLLCPFNKVEESFHLQATHDILVHGKDIASYDHLEFPGVVPRTFLGALYLSIVSLPAAAAVRAFALPKIFLQIGVRLTLAAAVVTAFNRMKWGIEEKFGRRTAIAATLLVSITPHFLFYAGRTLPNVFAVYLVTNGVAEWLRMERLPEKGYPLLPFRLVLAVMYFVLAVLWFRCDMLVLLGPVALSWLATRKATFLHLFVIGGIVGTVSLATTVLVDSWFWRRWLWPEGEVLFFNTVENRSHEYGVSPWHWYFTSALPRSMLAGLLFVPLGMISLAPVVPTRESSSSSTYPALWTYVPRLRVDWRVAEYALPGLLFIGLYSALPHKETRFLFPALPLLFLAAGRGLVKAYRAALWLLLGPETVRPEPRPVAASSWDADNIAAPGSPAGIGARNSPRVGGAAASPSLGRSPHVRKPSFGPWAATPTMPDVPEAPEGQDDDESETEEFLGPAATGAAGKPAPRPSPLGESVRGPSVTNMGAETEQSTAGPEAGDKDGLRHRRQGSQLSTASSVGEGTEDEGSGQAAAGGRPVSRGRKAGLSLDVARSRQDDASVESTQQRAATGSPAVPSRARGADAYPARGLGHGLVRKLSRGVLGELEEWEREKTTAPGPLFQRILAVGMLLGIVGSILGSITATVIFVRVAMVNYPGGAAMQRMYSLYARDLRRAATVQRSGADLILWSLEEEGRQLPLCPELNGDVTSSSSLAEWARQCLGGACPNSPPWALAGGSAGHAAAASRRPCVSSLDDSRLRPIRVHIDVAAAESGVSRFGEAWHVDRSWVFSKAENLTKPEHFKEFDLLLTETPSKHSKSFQVVGREALPVYAGLGFDWRRLSLVVKTAPKIYIMQRIPDQVVFKPVKNKDREGTPARRQQAGNGQ